MQRNKKFKFFTLPAMLCLFSLLVAACGGSGASTSNITSNGKPAAAPADKQIFRQGMGDSDFQTLDPALNQSANSVLQGIFTGLVEPDNNGAVMDQLAASHQVSANGLTYIFTLKANLKFSDGTPLTTQDVAYSINRAVDPATKSPVSYYLALLKHFDEFQSNKIKTLIGDSIVIKDANTIALTISKPAVYFLQSLGYCASFVVEKKLIDQYGDKWTDHLDQGGGAGPWKVQSYSHTQGITLIPNENYYGPRPQLQRWILTMSGDRDTTWKAFLSGQLDDAGVPPTQNELARSMPGYHNTPTLTTRYIAMNYLAKPLDIIEVRQALALAVNKDLIVKTILRGDVHPTNHIVPEGMPGYFEGLTGPADVTGTAGDPDKAKQLLQIGLQKGGYANAAALPPITLTGFTGYKQAADTLTAIADQWKAILGVNVRVVLLDPNELQKQEGATNGHAGPLMMWYDAWQADYPDPQDWLSMFFARDSGYNNFNYGQNSSAAATEQRAVQNTLAQADVNPNNTTRMKAYNKAEQQIVNDVGWLPTYQSAVIVVANPKIQNYPGLNAMSVITPDTWANVYVSQ